MSSQQKTIVINPELFSTANKKKIKAGENNTTRKKEKKVKPIIPDSVPNSKTLRKQFIKKIKEKQAESEKQYKLLEKQEKVKEVNNNSLAIVNNNKTFQDEFTKSLAYLTALSESREKEKIKKRNDQKEQKKMNFTLKRDRNNNNNLSEIQLELPESLKPIPNEINIDIHNIQSISKIIPKVHTSRQIEENFNQQPIISKQIINNFSNTFNKLDPIINVDTKVPDIKDPPPYGCLKGGSKPTFKEWTRNNRTLKSYPENRDHDLNKEKDRLKIEDFNKSSEISEREKRLQILKDQYSVKHKIPENKSDNTNKIKKYNYTRTIKKTTTIRNFKLGKNPKRKTISVLIKNGATRKRVKTEIAELKRKGLNEIKEYLRARNLLKVGSDAPPDVLRQMYETSILTGEINNLSSENLVHNFLNS